MYFDLICTFETNSIMIFIQMSDMTKSLHMNNILVSYIKQVFSNKIFGKCAFKDICIYT
jgi:hypothetical protein